jgi:ligand-binding sensor domain-containing protein/serine phosphatase RsbU (regulator of sigma subunit)
MLRGLDPQKAVTQYKLDIWQLERGFPQNSVFAVLQSRSGYIWLGTLEGLVRFDGIRFEAFNKHNTKQLTSNVVNALCEGRDGSLWIGTEEGLSCFKDGIFTSRNPKSGRRLHYISAIIEAKDGSIWIATGETGVTHMQGMQNANGASFITYTTDSGLTGNEVHDILEDKNGNLWIATTTGLTKRTPAGIFSRYSGHAALANRRIFSLCETTNGDLWVGTQDGLYRVKNGAATHYGIDEGLPKQLVMRLHEDKDGNLWGGTDGGGLFRVTGAGGEISALTPDDGPACGFIRAIHEDRGGGLWIGTLEGGLHRLRDAKFTNYTTKEGLAHDYVNRIYCDRVGNLRFGTNGGVNLLKNGKLMLEFTSRRGLLSDIVYSTLNDREGNLWIGTRKGLHRFRQGKLTTFTKKHGLTDHRVSNLLEDKQGTVWIATPRNLHRFQNGKLAAFSKKERLFADNIWCLHEDRKGNLWIGTAGSGLHMLKDGHLTPYTTRDGLVHNCVVCIYEDESDDGEEILYIGTEGGLSRFELETGKFTNFTIRSGLIDNHVYCILGDESENLWLAGRAGISRIGKKALTDFASGKIEHIHPVTYNEMDGMRTRWCKDSAAKTRDGKLWFATDKGVAMIDPAHIRKNTLPPPVVIEEIKVDGERIAFNAGELHGDRRTVIPPGIDRLEFDYTAPCFIKPAQVTFKIKMEGYDADWLDVGNNRSTIYTGLPPGKYTFKVQACNSDGAWNEAGDSFTFYLKPFFYQTTWFLILAVLLVITGVFSGFRLRVNQLKARERRLSVLVEQRTKALNERTRELEKAHMNLRESKRIIEEKNLNITASIEYALKIQQAMLPLESTIKKELDDYFIIYKPRDIVSGDFYWFYRGGGTIFIAAVDCTGHGVPGAFLSMLGTKELNDIVGEGRIPEPAHLLQAMDSGIRKTLQKKKIDLRGGAGMGMEASLCMIDIDKGKLTFAGAKRPLYYVKNGEFFEIKGDRRTIGGRSKKEPPLFTNHEINIDSETTIYLTTDGFADQNNIKNKKYGSNRLKRFLHDNAHLGMTQQEKALLGALKKHQGTEEQRDDITIIGIKLKGRRVER